MMPQLPHTCPLQKRYRKQKFTYTGGTGTPAIGQTVTGGTSLKTAVIDRIYTGYIVVKTLSGTFTVGETLTTATWSGTLSAVADHKNQSNEYEYYWMDDQTAIACRFYYSGKLGGKGVIIHETGQLLDQPLKCALPASCTVEAMEYRVVNTVTGFSGTYDIVTLYPLTGIASIHHYEAVLRKAP